MTNIGAAFTVRFLRNGDSITITRLVLKPDGTGASLFQAVDTTSGTVAPDWGTAANQPIIRLKLNSAAGYPVSIPAVRWAFDGQALSFTFNGTTWVGENNSKPFKARFNEDGNPELKITGNIASKTAVSNKQIDYEIDYVTAAHHETIEGTVDILIQQAGSNSHMLQITTDRVELSGESTDATYKANLSIDAYYGINPVTVGSSGYTTKWYKDGTDDSNFISGSDNKTSLTVTRDDVDGGSIYVCKLFLNGNAVAQDQQRINDISDEYQIEATVADSASNFVGLSNNAVYNLRVSKNKTKFSDTENNKVTYNWQIYNAWGEITKEGDGKTVTITADDCKKKGGSEYSEVDVAVSATF
ncbi:MAG: hypothetical protein ACI4T5_09655 [Prevotella sp.]